MKVSEKAPPFDPFCCAPAQLACPAESLSENCSPARDAAAERQVSEMRAVIQRVKYARLSIDGQLVSAIDNGFLVLLGIHVNDAEEDARYIAKKTAGLRVFDDANDHTNLSPDDVGGKVLLVSQFTLYGDCSRGYRPGFTDAARPEKAIPLYELVISLLREKLGEDRVLTGVFGADMQIDLCNDGPVTIVVNSESN